MALGSLVSSGFCPGGRESSAPRSLTVEGGMNVSSLWKLKPGSTPPPRAPPGRARLSGLHVTLADVPRRRDICPAVLVRSRAMLLNRIQILTIWDSERRKRPLCFLHSRLLQLIFFFFCFPNNCSDSLFCFHFLLLLALCLQNKQASLVSKCFSPHLTPAHCIPCWLVGFCFCYFCSCVFAAFLPHPPRGLIIFCLKKPETSPGALFCG